LKYLGSRKNSLINGGDTAGKAKESVSTNPGDFANFPEIKPTSVTNL
jgi:hypothetical protein